MLTFWNYTTLAEVFHKSGLLPGMSNEELYKNIQFSCLANGAISLWNQLVVEQFWMMDRKPYYVVYPAITRMLRKLNLDIDCGAIKLPLRTFLIRFPIGNTNPLSFTWEDNDYFIQSIMVGEANLKHSDKGISIYMDAGEKDKGSDFGLPDTIQQPVYTYRNFGLVDGSTIEKQLKALPNAPSANIGLQIPKDLIDDCVRIVCSICLFDNDPSIIEADVINADQEKYASTHDEKYVKKAHKVGKRGWVIGKHIEVIPHLRRPHPALYHVGKGRVETRIVFRKGAIVHREVVEKVPSGNELTDKEKEV